MSEGLKIVLTAVSGVVIFVIGQIIQKWFIEPIQEQRKIVGEIVYALAFYANLFNYNNLSRGLAKQRYQAEKVEEREAQIWDEAFAMVKGKMAEGSEKLRGLSSQIHQSIQLIPCYLILEKLGIVYKRRKLYAIAIKLIEWANSPEKETTIECQNGIIHLLNVKHLINHQREENI